MEGTAPGTRKVGRNEPCPCGSGRKFKRCCLGKPVAVPRSGAPVEGIIGHRLTAQRARKRLYGEVRPIISTVHKGHRFVAVGSRLFFDKNWKTFPDFLHDYLRHVFGSGWWDNEMKKPDAERHPVVRSHLQVRELRSSLPVGPNGFIELDQEGAAANDIHLAYDLYVLRHQGKLQKEIVRRLRQARSFEGARHELFVAATFVRAGFDIAYEDETDPSKKHPEFIATHGATGFKIAVEAKSKHRATAEDGAPQQAKVKALLVDAAQKADTEPLVVFIELNLHDRNSPDDRAAWAAEIDDTVDQVTTERGGAPFVLGIFSNNPGQAAYVKEAMTGRLPAELVEGIETAVRQYPNVPNALPNGASLEE